MQRFLWDLRGSAVARREKRKKKSACRNSVVAFARSARAKREEWDCISGRERIGE
jgi:hypothetical protein